MPSIGEAAAKGLSAGYTLAVDADERAKRAQRQADIDAQQVEHQAYVRGRQERADRMQALGLQGQALQQEGLALQGTNPNDEARRRFADRVNRFKQIRDAELAAATGYTLDPEEQDRGLEDIARLQAGDVQNTNLSRAISVGTGRKPADYIRGEGPSVVEQAAENLLAGIESGDEKTLLRGANVMFGPELRRGIGAKSPHGGVIVGKQIIGLDKVPDAHPDDPQFVPRLRVYVKGDKPMNGPVPEGVPPGATGYYDAPLTQNRSSDPNDLVKPISLTEALDWIKKQGEVVELMNTPEAQQKLQEEQASGEFDPDAYFQRAMVEVGASGGKKSVKDQLVRGPDGTSYTVRQEYDARGNPVGTPKRVEIEGNPAPGSKPVRGAMAQKIAAIEAQGPDGSGRLTQDEVDRAVENLINRDTTRPPPRSSSGGGGGGGGAGGKIHKTEKDAEGYLLGVFKDGSTRRLLVNGKPVKSQDFEKRIDKIAHDASEGIGGLGKTPKQLRDEARELALDGLTPEEKPAKPTGKAGGLTKDAAAKKFGF
jgi:hypothetical protein